MARTTRPTLPALRPRPWPPTPYGPYRLRPDGRLEKFETDGPAVIEWIEGHCVFTADRWRGAPLRLLQWQRQLLIDLFEIVFDAALGIWRRRYRSAFVGVPKKQGKTELAAALADYFLLGSGEDDPRVACAAAADRQADLVFGAARSMVELSPTLRPAAEVFTREIQGRGPAGGWVRRVPANGGKFDGQNLLIGIEDELHEWQTDNQRKTHGMISGAFATRVEPLHLMITTAGESDDGDDDEVAPWLRMYRYGLRVQAGEVDDPTFFFRWWSAPEKADWRDPAVVADPLTNPSYGITTSEAFYAAERGKRTESEFRRYYLNQPQEALNTWVDGALWDECASPGVALVDGAETFVGWDASTKRDSTAVVAVQRQEIDGRARIAVEVWLWERPFTPNGSSSDWTVPVADVLARIEDLHEAYRAHTAYDPAFVTWSADELSRRGLDLVEWPQTDARMVPASGALYEAVVGGEIAHNGDPALRRHVLAAKGRTMPRGGFRLSKDSRGRRIDAAIALAMAVGLMRSTAEAAEEPPPAYYSAKLLQGETQ